MNKDKEENMSKPKTITIDGVEYVRADSQPQPGPLSLVIMHRGFIYVGHAERTDAGVKLTHAANVRKWTQGGIGGLTQGATSSGATLDPCTSLVIPDHAILAVHTLPEGWGDA